jgi:hypothetical protein
MSEHRLTDPVLLEALRRAVDQSGPDQSILAAKQFMRADCPYCAESICDECVPLATKKEEAHGRNG